MNALESSRPNQGQTQSVAYEFPIGKSGKLNNFVAGNVVKEDLDLGEPVPVFLKNGPR